MNQVRAEPIETISPPSASERLHSLDALRAAAMLLGVVLHASVTYMSQPMQGLVWPIHEPASSRFFDVVFWVIHAFRIPMFFVISGFFAAMLVHQRGLGAFAAHRIRRLLIPLAASLVLVLLPVFYVWSLGWMLSGRATWEEVWEWNFRDDELRANKAGPAHLWFLEYLLIYSVLWWVWARVFFGKNGYQPNRTTAFNRLLDRVARSPGRAFFGAAITGTILLLQPQVFRGFHNTFVPDLWELTYYGVYFIVGIMLFGVTRRHGLAVLDADGMTLTLAAVFPLMLLVWAASSNAGIAATSPIQLAVGVSLLAWMLTCGLLALGMRWLRSDRPWVRYLADASYWIYLVHLPLVGLAAIGMSRVSAPPAVKFIVVVVAVSLVSVLSYHWLVRYRAIGALLHGRRIRARIAP